VSTRCWVAGALGVHPRCGQAVPATKHRRDVDRKIATAYAGKSHDLLADAEAWVEEQAWPEK